MNSNKTRGKKILLTSLGGVILLISLVSLLLRKDDKLDQYKTVFRNSLIANCMMVRKNNLAKDKSNFCTCTADAYVDRYDTNQLRRINEFASNVENATTFASLMMLPDFKKCEKKFGIPK